ncbi:hypothetical protein AVEN_215552-1 [Araneus ventricosus]|uniref:Uncharacterized protein n=1 Tax=Araneus ventricosus TaxID=182803 RepID=A0A4Y2BF16_ARAVE|nr:hypothetical protein AVEN_215552-1 [Araneus ventricosus]
MRTKSDPISFHIDLVPVIVSADDLTSPVCIYRNSNSPLQLKRGRCQVPLFLSSGPDTNFSEHPFRWLAQRYNPVRKKLPDRKFHSGRLVGPPGL